MTRFCYKSPEKSQVLQVEREKIASLEVSYCFVAKCSQVQVFPVELLLRLLMTWINLNEFYWFVSIPTIYIMKWVNAESINLTYCHD